MDADRPIRRADSDDRQRNIHHQFRYRFSESGCTHLGDEADYIDQGVDIVDTALARPHIDDGIVDRPTSLPPQSASRLPFGHVRNDNDCHQIARAVSAAAGAVFNDYSTFSLNPKENQEYGFWRIAYRGTDANSTSDWSKLLKAGDIVRMAWTKGGGPHTITVLGVNKDGSFEVYDNTYHEGNKEEIGIHTVRYDEKTIAKSITIFRLTPDHLFLINGGAQVDTLVGTLVHR